MDICPNCLADLSTRPRAQLRLPDEPAVTVCLDCALEAKKHWSFLQVTITPAR